jgi:hypothetical protein
MAQTGYPVCRQIRNRGGGGPGGNVLLNGRADEGFLASAPSHCRRHWLRGVRSSSNGRRILEACSANPPQLNSPNDSLGQPALQVLSSRSSSNNGQWVRREGRGRLTLNAVNEHPGSSRGIPLSAWRGDGHGAVAWGVYLPAWARRHVATSIFYGGTR